MLAPLLLALAAASPTVSPDAQREARELAHRSQLEYDLDHADEALRDIERAYLLDPLPGLLFNLGQCHRKLGHWEQAETAFRNYLRYKPDAPNREVVLELIRDVHRKLLEERPETPEVVVVPAAVPVPRAAPAPAPRPAPAATPPRPAAQPVAAPPAGKPPEELPVEAWSEKAPPPPAHSHTLAWVLVGVGVAAAAVAVVGAVEVAQFQSQSGSVAASESTQRGVLSPSLASLASQQSQAVTWRAAGFVGLGVGLAAVPAVIFTW